MRLLILGENCFIRLTGFDKTISSTFSMITSIYARQLAAVTPKHHTVVVVENNDDIDYKDECDAVLIHFKTGAAQSAYVAADAYRKKGKTVLVSGAHPSALPDEAKTHADSVLVGNAEDLWPLAVADLEKGRLQPRYESAFKNGSKTQFSESIVMPVGTKIIGILEATRGCPYKCDFCQESNVLYGSVFRKRPIKEVIAEITSLPQKFLFFCDASLTIDPPYIKSLFREMKGLNKKFVCEGNADVLGKDEELVKLSNDAGCIEWTVGFESFSQQTLNGLHKKTNKIEEYIQVVENIHKYNMAILGNFIFGFDQDTPDIFDYAEEKIAGLGLDSARFAVLTPYPGTPLFKKLDIEGRILTRDWSKYNRKTVVFQPKNMSSEELQNGFDAITRNFNSISNLFSRDLQSLTLGLYPFIATLGRNFESYINKRRRRSL